MFLDVGIPASKVLPYELLNSCPGIHCPDAEWTQDSLKSPGYEAGPGAGC